MMLYVPHYWVSHVCEQMQDETHVLASFTRRTVSTVSTVMHDDYYRHQSACQI